MRLAVSVSMLSICVHLTVSGMLLTLIGDPYISDGGFAALKIHPASYLSLIAGGATLLSVLTRRPPALLVLWTLRELVIGFALLLFTIIYEIIFTGIGNPIVLIDTFLPAYTLAFSLSCASTDTLRRLGVLLYCGFALNAAIALVENITRAHLITPMLDGHIAYESENEFRSLALYDHPLTGSMVSLIGFIMGFRIHRYFVRLTYQLLLFGALIAFGGRVALLTALIIVVWLPGRKAAVSLLQRKTSLVMVLLTSVFIAAAVLIGGVMAIESGLGVRLRNHFYWDPSAQVRMAQWEILGHLDLEQWLVGCARPDLLRQVNMLFLTYGVEVIENFWLLMFISLGVLGFPFFVAGFVALLVSCWRQSNYHGRMMIVLVMLVASTSNSLGRKSPLLVLMVAALSVLSRHAPLGQSDNAKQVHA